MYYRRKSRSKSGFFRFLVYIAFFYAFFACAKYLFLDSMLEAKDPSSNKSIVFEIKNGENPHTVGEHLAKDEIIKSSYGFVTYMEDKALDKKMKAGNFILKPSMDIPQIALTLTNDTVTETAIVIQEGLTIAQIDDKLTKMGLIKSGDLNRLQFKDFTDEEAAEIPQVFRDIFKEGVKSFEGMLFPDTYFVNPANFTLKKFVIRLFKNMDAKLDDKIRKAITENNRSMYEILTMASILEKEVNTDKDIATVAGILWKRYDSNWQIGADATLLYTKDNNIISATDLESDSAYNTRKFLGLPPTPISNPGLKCLIGAVYPKDSNYWYYLTSSKTGEVIYAVSNDDHNKNKVKYLK